MFRDDFLTKLDSEPEEKGKEATGNNKKSSGDGALKLQISVPCRGQMRPQTSS